MRRRDQPLAEERAADLEHQLVIVAEAELEDPLEGADRPLAVAQLEAGLSDAGEAVLVVGVERQRVVEAAPGPRVVLAREVRVRHADVQFDRVGVEGDAVLQNGQSIVIPAFVVELMGLFVEVVGAEKCFRHRQDLR